MTPKEKAIELCQKFAYTSFQDEFNDGKTLPLHIAKKCALIAAKEAQDAEYKTLTRFKIVTQNYKSNFWEQVKQEIENL